MPAGRRTVFGAALAIAVAACNGAAAPSTAPGSPSSTAIDLPTFDPASYHAYPELEKRLPTNVGDVALETRSYPPSNGAGAGSDALAAALTAAGRSDAELQLATTLPADASVALAMWAMAVPNMPGAELLSIARAADVDDAQEERDVGGKHVIALTGPDGAVSYLYAAGDIVFLVGGDPALVEQALAALS